ncbi:unnamed protein product [Trifolium pratense]|uniref:Uncharacterized protein n=1 Tax=Trifolium pratense TaxID=57577 RepID=A0ACB0LEN8_TRIPR|nr:unnamed protein product [Trifolium pratense]
MKSRIVGSFSSMEIILDPKFFFFQDQQELMHISDCYGEKVSKLTMTQVLLFPGSAGAYAYLRLLQGKCLKVDYEARGYEKTG